MDSTRNSVDDDMRTRFMPTGQAVGHALALLVAEPEAEVAFIPMFLPGKTYGIWMAGQPVFTVPGVVVLGTRTHDAAEGVLSGARARDLAAEIAASALRAHDESGGVVARATVRRDGSISVHEDPIFDG